LIPKTIHYCWFGGGPKSELIQKCMNSWQQALPDYAIKEWNEHNSPLDSDYARRACSEKAWAFLADIVRLHALYTEGGIYLDTDVKVLKEMDPLLGDSLFLGFQLKQENIDWVGTSIIGSISGHPFLKIWMDRTLKCFVDKGGFNRGPMLITSILKEMGLNHYGLQQVGGVKLYPIEHFYPYSWFERLSQDAVKEETFCIHHWAGSWVEPPPLLAQILMFLRNLFPPSA
jgi:hypothetical protein